MTYLSIAPLLLLIAIPLSGFLMLPYLVEKKTAQELIDWNAKH